MKLLQELRITNFKMNKTRKSTTRYGILYAPDFLINAGGLINVYSEINGYNRENAIDQTRKIFDTTLEIFYKAKEENITTQQAALKLAMEQY